ASPSTRRRWSPGSARPRTAAPAAASQQCRCRPPTARRRRPRRRPPPPARVRHRNGHRPGRREHRRRPGSGRGHAAQMWSCPGKWAGRTSRGTLQTIIPVRVLHRCEVGGMGGAVYGVPIGPARGPRLGCPLCDPTMGGSIIRAGYRGFPELVPTVPTCSTPAPPIEPAGHSPDTPITYIHTYDSLEEIYIYMSTSICIYLLPLYVYRAPSGCTE